MDGAKIKLGALWMRQKDDGSVSISGKLEIENVNIFPNDFWEEGSNKPTHIIWGYGKKKGAKVETESVTSDAPKQTQFESQVSDKIPF